MKRPKQSKTHDFFYIVFRSPNFFWGVPFCRPQTQLSSMHSSHLCLPGNRIDRLEPTVTKDAKNDPRSLRWKPSHQIGERHVFSTKTSNNYIRKHRRRKIGSILWSQFWRPAPPDFQRRSQLATNFGFPTCESLFLTADPTSDPTSKTSAPHFWPKITSRRQSL